MQGSSPFPLSSVPPPPRTSAPLRALRSLHVQLFLWAILPVTFVIIALAFTGVYAHQREMRDFVARRNLATARLAARTVEDALAYGIVGLDGRGLAVWLSTVIDDQAGAVIVVDGAGRVLAHPDTARVGENLASDPGVAAALRQRKGYVIVSDDTAEGPVLVAFAPVGGSDWAVLVQEPVEGFIGPILRLSNLAPLVAASAGMLSVLVLIFGWFTIVRPLQRLSRAAGQVSWGDFSAIREPVGGVQEVRDLHQALAEMVERIQGYEAGMRDYLGAVTRGQEAERARLARELHDGPVQELIALGQRAEMARQMVERGETAQGRELLIELRSAGLRAAEELRRLIAALRPVYLEDLGLLPALEMLVQQAAGRTTAHVRLEMEGAPCRFEPEVELAAYRVAQEALNNALQHARAQNIVVRVRCAADGLTLSVSDDGIGFDLPQRPDLLTQAGHFGLVGLRERVAQFGGDFQVHTAPGAGMLITVHLPGKPLAA